MRTTLIVLWLLVSPWCLAETDTDLLYQTARIDELLAGRYDGKAKLGAVKKFGDFGLGTFNRLDGEMLLLDGVFYQIKDDGKAYTLSSAVTEATKTPFATVTFFEAEHTASTDQPLGLDQLYQLLDSILPNKETFYAVKIEGGFKSIKARTPLQQKKPYPPIQEVERTQKIFEFKEVKGTLVGFRCPESVKGINFPGYHFHFLSEDKQSGGHLLDITTDVINVLIDETPRHQVATKK